MKISIAALTLSLCVCMMAQSPQTNSSKVFHTSGAFVYISSPSGTGSQVWLYASHVDRPQVATFLEFDIFTPNPDGSSTDTFGFGEVPGDVITGNVRTELTLHVDTSQASSFQTTTCTSNGGCQSGPFGLIQIDFRADGDFTARSIYQSRQDFVQTTQHSHYDDDSASSLANGSLLSHSVSNASSQIGTNRSTTIEITRKR